MNILLSGKLDWIYKDIENNLESGIDRIISSQDEESFLSDNPSEIHAVICNWFFKYHDITKFTGLKYIQLLSAGYNGIDPEAVKKMGIELHNARDVYSIPISEFVVGNIIAFYKKSHYFFSNQKDHRWEKNRNLQEIYGKKVLIIGTGSIGNEIAKRLSVFTPYIYGCNRTCRDNSIYIDTYPLEQLVDIIDTMDILILSIALTEDTEHLIDRPLFDRMKKNVLIVNISRGKIINETEMISFLKENPNSGAVLDVFEQEPLPADNPLWNINNVILTPHNSFVSDRNQERLRKKIIENFSRWKQKRENL